MTRIYIFWTIDESGIAFEYGTLQSELMQQFASEVKNYLVLPIDIEETQEFTSDDAHYAIINQLKNVIDDYLCM